MWHVACKRACDLSCLQVLCKFLQGREKATRQFYWPFWLLCFASLFGRSIPTRTRQPRLWSRMLFLKIRRPVRRQIPVFVLVHSQMFCSRFELLQHLNSRFVSLLKPKKAHIFVGTLICNTSNCLVFGILISTPFQCLLTYISKHLSRSPPFPPRRGCPAVVASCCSVDRKWRVPQRLLVGTSAGGNVR